MTIKGQIQDFNPFLSKRFPIDECPEHSFGREGVKKGGGKDSRNVENVTKALYVD